MIFIIPDNWRDFKPHLMSMKFRVQDDGFGGSVNAPLNTCEQVCAFIGIILPYEYTMCYLEH